MHSLLLSLALLFSVPDHQPLPAQPVDAVAPAEGRTLRHSGVVNTSASELWKTFTTPQGWTNAIGVAKCEVDFRIGGTIRSVYDPAAIVGDDSTITNAILAYEPARMLAFKPAAPKNAPEHVKAICETGWTVIRFEPLTPDRARLTISMMGFQSTELHNRAYDFFDKGNAWTLKRIQDHFAAPEQANAVDDAEKLISRMNGTWSFTKERPDGGTFGGSTEGKILFDGKLLVADGSLTVGGKTFQHSHFLAYRDPETKTLRAWSLNEQGDVTEGQIRVEGTEKLAVDWHTHQASDNRFVEYRVEYTFNGPDEFRCVVLNAPEADGTRKQLVDVTYKRTTN